MTSSLLWYCVQIIRHQSRNYLAEVWMDHWTAMWIPMIDSHTDQCIHYKPYWYFLISSPSYQLSIENLFWWWTFYRSDSGSKNVSFCLRHRILKSNTQILMKLIYYNLSQRFIIVKISMYSRNILVSCLDTYRWSLTVGISMITTFLKMHELQRKLWFLKYLFPEIEFCREWLKWTGMLH